MIKKITLGLIFTLIAGVLIVGAANRTTAKSEQYNLAETVAQNGIGGGGNRDGERQYANQHEPLYLEKEESELRGQGQGNGRSVNNESANETDLPLGGQGQGNVAGNGLGNGVQNQDADRYGNPEAPTSHDMLTMQGIVTTAPAGGVDLVINTTDGDLTIGTGPSYWLETVIVLTVGDEISVTGYWEEGEFKAASLTRLSDNLFVTLREENGRPLWGGSVGNITNGQGQGRGQGQGGQRQGNGQRQAEG